MLVGLSLLFGGVLLIRGAMKDEHPWNPIVQAFGGDPLPPPGSASAAVLTSEAPSVSFTNPTVPTGFGGSAVIQAAMQFLGMSYRLGGTGTDGTIDCSGLVMRAYAAVGVSLPHWTLAIRGVCKRLKPSQVQPGDIIGYWKLDGALFDHVAIYIDGPLDSPGGRMIEATPHDGGVAIVSTDHQGIPSGYYRPPGIVMPSSSGQPSGGHRAP